MPETLDQVLRDALDRMSRAVRDRTSPMHTPVVATADADVRVMVLRHFDRDDWTLRFHTDARAPKVDAIADGAPLGVLFYDREAKIQIRCHGRGWIERDGPVADTAWAESTRFARRCYLGAAPGEPSDGPTSGLPATVEGIEPADEDLAPARANFAVLLVRVATIDWFYLDHHGHRRAVFEAGEGRWVAP